MPNPASAVPSSSQELGSGTVEGEKGGKPDPVTAP
jgi:hypothetical protein